MDLPRRTESQQRGSIGITIVSKVVAKDLGMYFRTVPQEFDYGIDGYIDYVIEGSVTGGSIAVQVKYGKSYFDNEAVDGYWYSGSNAQINYYANMAIPVFVFLVHPETEEIYWEEVDIEKLHKSGENWKMVISKENTLTINFLAYFRKIMDIEEHSSEIRDHIETKDLIAEVLSGTDSPVIAIGRQSIEACNTRGVVALFESFKTNKDRIKNLQGKINFFVYGYDDDPRELYEIPEVVKFFTKLEPEVKYWYFFLSTNKDIHSLTVLMSTVCHGKKREGGLVEIDKNERIAFMERNFGWLNDITEYLNLPLSENKKISEDIINYSGWV